MIQIKHEFGSLFIMNIHSNAGRHVLLVPTGIALGRGFQKSTHKICYFAKNAKI